MAKAANAKSRRRAKPLYFSAKISDYQFKKVLWQFVLDHSAAEAAKHVNLSANSITAIYAKLRKFFFDYRLFRDPYKGGDPRNGFAEEGYEDIEHLILAYHLTHEAVELVRSLVDKIVLTPNPKNTGLLIDVYGDLAGILHMSVNKEGEKPQQELDLKQIRMVVGLDPLTTSWELAKLVPRNGQRLKQSEDASPKTGLAKGDSGKLVARHLPNSYIITHIN